MFPNIHANGGWLHTLHNLPPDDNVFHVEKPWYLWHLWSARCCSVCKFIVTFITGITTGIQGYLEARPTTEDYFVLGSVSWLYI